jgi:hypothetical protein
MKELPYAIAPDGEVIQITMVENVHSNLPFEVACKKCYLLDECEDSKGRELPELLGVDCGDYDDDEEFETPAYAYWRKV